MIECDNINWLSEYFFMYIFFASEKSENLSGRNTCIKLFITYIYYIFLVAMKSKVKISQALVLLAKDVGDLDIIICDIAGDQILKELQKLCQ